MYFVPNILYYLFGVDLSLYLFGLFPNVPDVI